MPTVSSAPGAIAAVFDLIVPPICPCCASRRAVGNPDHPLCRRCGTLLASQRPIREVGPRGVGSLFAVGPYEGIAGELVRALKFSKRLSLAAPAAEAMASALGGAGADWTVVPVPPSPLRWLRRGFDPAEELAIALADATGRPYARCLRRSNGPRQAGRGRAKRLSSPPRVFAAGPVPDSALLVDDVVTTGATGGSCAAALGEAGCSQIGIVCLARAGTRHVASPLPRGL